MSSVTCHMSHVASHLSRQKPNTQILPLLTPPLCTVGQFTRTPNQERITKQKILTKVLKTPKQPREMPLLAVCSLTRSLQLKPFGHIQRLRTMGQTNIATIRLNPPWPNSMQVILEKWLANMLLDFSVSVAVKGNSYRVVVSSNLSSDISPVNQSQLIILSGILMIQRIYFYFLC